MATIKTPDGRELTIMGSTPAMPIQPSSAPKRPFVLTGSIAPFEEHVYLTRFPPTPWMREDALRKLRPRPKRPIGGGWNAYDFDYRPYDLEMLLRIGQKVADCAPLGHVALLPGDGLPEEDHTQAFLEFGGAVRDYAPFRGECVGIALGIPLSRSRAKVFLYRDHSVITVATYQSADPNDVRNWLAWLVDLAERD